MKIGIPRSMYFYYYKDLWINFFEYLKVEVIVSPETNKKIMDLGIKYSNDEMCLSMKVFLGHVSYLQGKCDYILIPRIDNYGIDNQTCTNFLAIYDIVNNLFDTKILNYNINLKNKEDELSGLIKIMKNLGFTKKEIKDAYIYASVKANKLKKSKVLSNLRNLRSEKKKILLVGHPYNVYDRLIGSPITTMLNNLGVKIIYSDLFFVKNEYKKYTEGLYWKYNKDNIGSISKCIERIDGIIFLSSFPCGPDSLVNELVMRKIDKPYLNIIIDDIESLGGIETRLESFVDIVTSI